MSKITRALEKASEERTQNDSQADINHIQETDKNKEGMMGKTFTWTFIIAAVIVVFIAFNYQSGQDAVPLSEIFPEDVDYEFVQEEKGAAKVNTPAEVAQVNVVTEAKKIVDATSVKVEAEKAKTEQLSYSLPVKTKTQGINYTVQIASFKDKKRAEEALLKIRTKIPNAYISTHDLGSKGTWHRIYSGQYQMRDDAEVALFDIKRNYDTSFIISPKRAK